jgi:hypothetical protein
MGFWTLWNGLIRILNLNGPVLYAKLLLIPLVSQPFFGVHLFSSNIIAFKTNKSGFKCFALLGEVFGSGVPVGFLLIKTNNPDPNRKEQYIHSVIRHFVEDWNLRVLQSLTDKDITEINALLAELPEDVKYQVCFWHSIKIVKGWLSVLARRLAFYDVKEAFNEFDWIDRDFVPIAQLDPDLQTPVRYSDVPNST